MSTNNTPEQPGDKVRDSHTPSDARIILGPLVTYALMGLVLVSVIISTAVLLDSQFNDIDQAARLDKEPDSTHTNAETRTTSVAESTNRTSGSQVAQPQRPIAVPSANESNAVSGDTVSAEAEHVESTMALPPQTAAVENRTAILPVEPAPVLTAVTQQRDAGNTVATDATAAVTDTRVTERSTADVHHRDTHPFEASFGTLNAERNAYLRQMDQIYLEQQKARQLRQLQYMRDRLARQEQRIKEREARLQRRYGLRSRDVEDRRETPDRLSADRI